MATLNTLRTKFGVVLSAIIAFALLAFILSLRTEMGFFSTNNPKIGEIGGDKIKYSEYNEVYQTIKDGNIFITNNPNADVMIAQEAWQTLIERHAYLPGFDRMGISVTDAERMSMLRGEHVSVVYDYLFRSLGIPYENVSEFLISAEEDPAFAPVWSYMNNLAVRASQMDKYISLVNSGIYVNSLEAEMGVEYGNSFDGKLVCLSYSSLDDADFSVSDNDIKRYYKEHKAKFRTEPSRTISYVTFEALPTQEDRLAINAEVDNIAAELSAADDKRVALRDHSRYVTNDETFVRVDNLPEESVELLKAGNIYGPVSEVVAGNTSLNIDVPLEFCQAPDSLGVKILALPATERALADSLINLRSATAFEEAMDKYKDNGSDNGVAPFAYYSGKQIAPRFASAAEGDIFELASNNVNTILLSYVYKVVGPKSLYVNLAHVRYPVRPSAGTVETVSSEANAFVAKAQGSVETFDSAAKEVSQIPEMAILNSGNNTVYGLAGSHEIVRWAYGEKTNVGDVSKVFQLGDKYVVAVVTAIQDDEYRSINSVASEIRAELIRQKKYDAIVAKINGNDIADIAASFNEDVRNFNDVTYETLYVAGKNEPRLVGAIASATQTDVLSLPVKGNDGVYLFVVENIDDSKKKTVEEERTLLQSEAEAKANMNIGATLLKMAEIKDFRNRYL